MKYFRNKFYDLNEFLLHFKYKHKEAAAAIE